MRKLLPLLSMASVIGLSASADYTCATNDAGAFVVTVPAGVTNVVDAAFVTALDAHAPLIKRGPGGLWSNPLIKDYAGDILVEEGFLMISTNQALGATSGSTVISNGASLVIRTNIPGGAPANMLQLGAEKVYLEGHGTADYPAAAINADTRSQYYTFQNLYLTGDATIGGLLPTGEGGGLLEVRGGLFHLDGHRLTQRTGFSLTRTGLLGGGNIDAYSSMNLEGAENSNHHMDWEGDSNCVFTVKYGTLMRARSGVVPYWTLVLEPGTGYSANQYNVHRCRPEYRREHR